jgi:hypothetical protein
MTNISASQLIVFFSKTDFDVESIIPGRDYDFAEGRYVDRDGKVDTAVGTIEHVADWNEFNEGNEDIHIVFKLNDQLFKAVLYNDSWSGDGHQPELTSLDEVEAKEVTVTRYEKVNR